MGDYAGQLSSALGQGLTSASLVALSLLPKVSKVLNMSNEDQEAVLKISTTATTGQKGC